MSFVFLPFTDVYSHVWIPFVLSVIVVYPYTKSTFFIFNFLTDV